MFVKKLTTKILIKTSLLSAIAFALTYLKLPPIPIFPSFLDIELSDLPALIGMFSLSPEAGVLILLIKNILGVILKPVGLGVGQLANFIIGCSLLLPLWYFYNKRKTLLFYTIGSVVGIFTMVFVACIANYFVLIPVYAVVFGQSIDFFVDITKAVNSLVTDFKTLIIFAIAPFNVVKGSIVVILGYYLHKLLKPVLSRI